MSQISNTELEGLRSRLKELEDQQKVDTGNNLEEAKAREEEMKQIGNRIKDLERKLLEQQAKANMENRQNNIRQENDKADEIQKLIELKIREHHNLLQIQELQRLKIQTLTTTETNRTNNNAGNDSSVENAVPAPLLLWAQGIENKFNMLMDTVTGKRKETETTGVHSYPNKSARTMEWFPTDTSHNRKTNNSREEQVTNIMNSLGVQSNFHPSDRTAAPQAQVDSAAALELLKDMDRSQNLSNNQSTEGQGQYGSQLPRPTERRGDESKGSLQENLRDNRLAQGSQDNQGKDYKGQGRNTPGHFCSGDPEFWRSLRTLQREDDTNCKSEWASDNAVLRSRIPNGAERTQIGMGHGTSYTTGKNQIRTFSNDINEGTEADFRDTGKAPSVTEQVHQQPSMQRLQRKQMYSEILQIPAPLLCMPPESSWEQLPKQSEDNYQRLQEGEIPMTKQAVQLEGETVGMGINDGRACSMARDKGDYYARSSDFTEPQIATNRTGELQIRRRTERSIDGFDQHRIRNGQNDTSNKQAVQNKPNWSYTETRHNRSQDDHRSEPTSWQFNQRTTSKDQVQVRDNRSCYDAYHTKNLHGYHRYQTCLSPHPYSPGRLGTPIIPNQWQILPRQIPEFWSINSSSYILNDINCSQRQGGITISNTDGSILGRVLSTTHGRDNSQQEARTIHQFTPQFRLSSKPQKDNQGLQAYQIFGPNSRHTTYAATSTREENGRAQSVVMASQEEPSTDFETSTTTSGQTKFLLQSSERGPYVYEKTNKLSKQETLWTMGSSTLGIGIDKGYRLVVSDDGHLQWDSLNTTTSRDDDYNRCMQLRLWGMDEPRGILLQDGIGRTILAHQHKRTFSHLDSASAMGSSNFKSSYNSTNGQSDCREMAQERICEIIDGTTPGINDNGDSQRNLFPCDTTQHSYNPKVDRGTEEHDSRCAKQTLYGTSAQRDKSEEDNEQARHIQALELAASKLIQLGLPLKENTENQIRAYLRWGLSFKFGEKELVPASENLLYYYIIWLSDSVSYGTIKNYVQAIVELHTRAGFTEFGKEIKTMNKVQTLLKALTLDPRKYSQLGLCNSLTSCPCIRVFVRQVKGVALQYKRKR